MRLHWKILIVFTFFFAVALTVLLYFWLDSQKELAKDVLDDLQTVVSTVHITTHRLATQKGREQDSLRAFIREAMRNSAVKEISIINTNRQIIASSDSTRVGSKHVELWQETIVRKQVGSKDSTRLLEISIPIMDDRKVIGQVQAYIERKDTGELLYKLMYKSVLVASIAFGAYFLIAFVTLYRFSKPMQKLSKAAERIASGDLSVQLKKTSSDEIGKLSASFNQMALKLQQQKDLEEKLRTMERRTMLAETAATLAHEIRNPLNLINLTAGHLAKQYLPQDAALRQSYLELLDNLKAQVDHLNTMVQEFLAIGKPLRINRNRFLLTDMVEQVEMLVKQQLVAKNIILQTDSLKDLHCIADLEQIRLVLLNLLMNAIEVSPNKSTITINGFLVGDKLTISVKDQGPGIKEEDSEKIFEPYFTKRPGGTGLGLTFAKRIVEAHGGKITVGNNSDFGAFFNIVMPQEESR